MIDLLIEYRHWLAGTVMGVGFVGLFIRQEVARKRRLRRMARECLAMSRDRKDSPSVSPSESSEAWLESHASELVDCARMRCRMLARHCGTRESCFHGGRCPKALRGSSRRRHHQDSRARPGSYRMHGGVSMSQSHEKQLIEALRAVCKPSGDDVPPGLGGESVRAIRRELAPLVELAAIPHQGYLDENAAGLYCSIPVKSLQKKRHLGQGPAFIKDGSKVLYARKDLDQYMAQKKVKTYER